jgi:hypothetical protein
MDEVAVYPIGSKPPGDNSLEEKLRRKIRGELAIGGL